MLNVIDWRVIVSSPFCILLFNVYYDFFKHLIESPGLNWICSFSRPGDITYSRWDCNALICCQKWGYIFEVQPATSRLRSIITSIVWPKQGTPIGLHMLSRLT